jgi:translation initiation factor 1A
VPGLQYYDGVVYIRSFSHRNSDPGDITVTDSTGVPTIRVRLPKKWNGEQFGRAEKMMGANHIQVLCVDGITRMGRIKGKIKKRAWIREGDFLIVAPWSFQDAKCDISYRYLPPQVAWLRRNRYIT